VQFDKAYVEGITKLGADDIKYAEQLGYRIKLLGITKRRRPEGVELRVHPSLIPAKRLIANVEGAMNAVVVQGRCRRATLYYGKGAGSRAHGQRGDCRPGRRHPPAHGRPEQRVPHLAFQPDAMSDRRSCRCPRSSPATTCACAWPTSRACWPTSRASWPTSRHQHRRGAAARAEVGRRAPQTDIIMLTHDHARKHVDAAIAQIEALSTVLKNPSHASACAWKSWADMKYISTRGHAEPQGSFCDILLGGLAPDGGLYLPESYPQVDAAQLALAAWRGTFPTPRWLLKILSLFIDDIPACKT
jgi:hypothetical protein